MPYYVLIFWLLLPIVGVMAVMWGGWPERAAAALYVAAAVLTLALRAHGSVSWLRVEEGVLATDLALLAAMFVIALRSDRWWPMVATAFLAISMMAHLAKMMNPGFSRLAYALMEGASSYPVVLTLLIAIIVGRKRRTANNIAPFAVSSPVETREVRP